MGSVWSPGKYQVMGGSAKTTVPGPLMLKVRMKSTSGTRTFALFGPVRPKNLKMAWPPGVVGGTKTTDTSKVVGGSSRARVEVEQAASVIMKISFSVRLSENFFEPVVPADCPRYARRFCMRCATGGPPGEGRRRPVSIGCVGGSAT